MSPAALVMPGPRPACQGLSVSRVITVCDPAFASVGSPHHGTASEQLRIICLHTVCVRPARRPSGHCHARPSARVSSTGLETQGSKALPLRSAHHRELFARLALLSADREKMRMGNFFPPPGGWGFFLLFCRLRRGRARFASERGAPNEDTALTRGGLLTPREVQLHST